MYIKNNGVFSAGGLLQISSAGAVVWLVDGPGTAWTASAAAAIEPQAVTYTAN